MSEIMTPMPFDMLMRWMITEYRERGSVFGVYKNKFYRSRSGQKVSILGKELSSPLGPAAGPNTQLAQNLVASYVAGLRFMELKTVQTMDGEELRKCIPRPCINAQDEGYNVEWSTELTVQQAYEEYVKGWFAVHVAMKEFGLSDVSDVMFNMSVGYDYAGITSEKIDSFINNLADASGTEVFRECRQWLLNNLDLFENITAEDIEAIPKTVSSSITLSTLHGCPPEEIEKIAHYFLTVKKMDTFIKVNPTLLGYEFVRDILNRLGYGYVTFDTRHFEQDLKFPDAAALIGRLMETAKQQGLRFGVKVTNTFPVQIKNGELPGEFMYMSGRALFPLSINVARKLSNYFNGKLPISYSGGADAFNIERILKTGIMPVTFATTILKPGGYARGKQLSEKAEKAVYEGEGIDVAALNELADSVVSDPHILKDAREVDSRKTDSRLPLFDCFKAPCRQGGCPIEQQIPEYLQCVARGDYDRAFEIIVIDNALPAVTGEICSHVCQTKCTRIDYDEPLQIRQAKRLASQNAQQKYIDSVKPVPLRTDKKVAVIGAGPGGIAAGVYLRRNGVDVTVYERREKPMGVVQYLIPEFRISQAAIDLDYQMAVKTGVQFRFGVKDINVAKLKSEYDYVVIATGAWKEGACPVKRGGDNTIDALSFLERSKAANCRLDLGKSVAVIGGGDVAMDCARAAMRANGSPKVTIVYRRTREFMPAQPEEIRLALEDGVELLELLVPVSYENGLLTVEVMKLGEKSEDGRRSVVPTGETKELPFDTVINAVGARVDTELFACDAIDRTDSGYAVVDEQSCQTSMEGVYISGDCRRGASTIVEAMADSKRIAKDILARLGLSHDFVRIQRETNADNIRSCRGVLADSLCNSNDAARCLNCDAVCEVCCEVCPNRANVSVMVEGRPQIVHVDGMCNECGNCGIFCPYIGLPYKDKFTLFWSEEGFRDSENRGVLFENDEQILVRDEDGREYRCNLDDPRLSDEYRAVIRTIREDCGYLIP
ncbi:MAG: putative selenate reductase subunit YgfK [Christensenellaceae bacterium]|nr:putative selenate reductase subunit YgfK [Christensenellaceae bacterium]